MLAGATSCEEISSNQIGPYRRNRRGHEKEVYHASTYPPMATVERRVVVTTQPPPVTVEQRVVSPGPEYVWIDGYWEWNGGRWVWRKGHWVRPPHHGHTWVAPRYENRTYYYGYWR